MTRIRAAAVVVLVVGAAVTAWVWRGVTLRDAADYVFAGSPHERYAAGLRLRGLADTPQGRAWMSVADAALHGAGAARVPLVVDGRFDPRTPEAAAWRLKARRGHRLVVNIAFGGRPVFVDVFAGPGLTRLASAAGGTQQLVEDVAADGDIVIRIQPALDAGGSFRLNGTLEASMRFPIDELTSHAVRSMFGASRDAGRRRHEGIDIFARAGTPVRAAADGWIGTSLSNRLGGNVVWVWSPMRRLSTYYAHLDRHAVAPGERVKAGDVIGYVGTTGNARGGPPHLHFGVYLSGRGSVDPLPFVCGAPCGGV